VSRPPDIVPAEQELAPKAEPCVQLPERRVDPEPLGGCALAAAAASSRSTVGVDVADEAAWSRAPSRAGSETKMLWRDGAVAALSSGAAQQVLGQELHLFGGAPRQEQGPMKMRVTRAAFGGKTEITAPIVVVVVVIVVVAVVVAVPL